MTIHAVRVADGPDLVGPPRLPHDLIHRTRLYDKLDRHAPLTVIRGPAGVGKSTLVAAWAERSLSDRVVAWVGFSRPVTAGEFWTVLLTAVSPGSAHAASLDDVLTAARALAEPVTIVLDDFDWVEDAMGGGLARLVAECALIDVVVCGRGPRTLASLPVPSAIFFGRSELLLKADELLELAALVGVPIRTDEAAEIGRATGGWTAPAKAALLAFDPDLADGRRVEVALTASEAYVQQSVLPDELRSFLSRCSVVHEMTGELAVVLSEDDRADTLLHDVESYGLATSIVHDEQRLYRLLPLMRRVLARGFERDDSDGFRAAHRRAARWYRDRGSPELAGPHAAAAHDWSLVGEIVDANFIELVTRYPYELRTTIQDLPEDVMAARPALRAARQVAMAVPQGKGPSLTAPRRERLALREMAASGQLRDAIALGSAQAIALRTNYAYSASCQLLDQIDAVLAGASTESWGTIEDLLPLLRLQWAIGRFIAGDIALATRDFTQAFYSARHASLDFVAHNAAGGLALVAALKGDLSRARSWLKTQGDHPLEESWFSERVRTWGRVSGHLIAVDELDATRVAKPLAASHGGDQLDELWPLICYANAQRSLLFGDPLQMLNEIAALEERRAGFRRELGLGGAVLASARVDLYLALGQGNRAVAAGRSVQDHHPLLEVSRARAELLTGDLAGARSRASNLVWRPETDHRTRVDMLLIDAVAALRQGDEAAALVAAARAVSVAEDTGALRSFAWLPRPDADKLLAPLASGGQILDRLAALDLPEVFPANLNVVRLSEREHVVLQQLVHTGSVDRIAEFLVVSANTVKSQRRSLYKKLGVNSREQALEAARRLGLM